MEFNVEFLSSITVSESNASFTILSLNNSITNSNIFAASFVVLGVGSNSIISSNLNASALGCRANTGPGRGAIIQYQTTHCTSGASSCGSGVLSNSEECKSIIQYFLFLNHAFPYLNKGAHVQTGSGGYGYNLENNGHGSGGGIILAYAGEAINLTDSNLIVSGGDVYT